MPTQTQIPKPIPKGSTETFGQSQAPDDTTQRPGTEKPVVFKDFASI